MASNLLFISNYSLKQLNEYKKLLARTMKLNRSGSGYRMNVKTNTLLDGRKNHTLIIHTENKVIQIHLITTGFFTVEEPAFYEMLNFKAEKMLNEEWIYGLKDVEGLDRVVKMMRQEVFGHVVHPTVLDKVSYLWYSLATAQFFYNGNKRTAMLAANAILNLNFYELTVTDEVELYNISLAIAEHQMSEKQLKEYLLSHAIVSTDMMDKFLNTLRTANRNSTN